MDANLVCLIVGFALGFGVGRRYLEKRGPNAKAESEADD